MEKYFHINVKFSCDEKKSVFAEIFFSSGIRVTLIKDKGLVVGNGKHCYRSLDFSYVREISREK